jgi:hypothetical protein
MKREVLPCNVDAVRKAKAAKSLPSAVVCEEFLARIHQGRSIRDVAQDADMPKQVDFTAYRKAYPAFDAKVIKALDALPLNLQITEKCESDGLRVLIIMLREWENLPWKSIDATLMLASGNAYKVYARMVKRGILTRIREMACA